MGRTLDHVAGFLCGFAAVPRVFAAGGQQFADNVVAFYEHVRDEHLYSPTRSCRRRSTAASRRTSRAIRRFMPASSRSATTASSFPARSSSRPAAHLFRLPLSELHPSAAARRRELRQRRRDPDQRAGLEALSAPAVRSARHQQLRLSAVQPLRRDRLLRRARQRVRSLGARLHLPQPRDLPRPVVEDARRTSTATTRRRPATSTKLRFMIGLAKA